MCHQPKQEIYGQAFTAGLQKQTLFYQKASTDKVLYGITEYFSNQIDPHNDTFKKIACLETWLGIAFLCFSPAALGSVLSEGCKFVGRSTEVSCCSSGFHSPGAFPSAPESLRADDGDLRIDVPRRRSKGGAADLVVTADMFAPQVLCSCAVNFAGASSSAKNAACSAPEFSCFMFSPCTLWLLFFLVCGFLVDDLAVRSLRVDRLCFHTFWCASFALRIEEAFP